MRLTKKHFSYLRKQDVIKILNNYYENNIDKILLDKIPDRKINGSKLISLLISYEDLPINEFIELLLNKII